MVSPAAPSPVLDGSVLPIADEIQPESQQQHSPFSQELRLGLVLFGGTSLAIYINGVTREFARIVRGEGAYRWLKILTDSDVVIDIVSGTSAGGINGIALAYALANSKDLRPLSDLWREHGDISSLFRPANASDGTVNSLFDGYAYREQLRDAFDRLGQTPYTRVTPYASAVGELDLFVTGTRVHGRRRTVFDSSGKAQLVDDHRTLFHLQHRPGRKQPFDPTFVNPVSQEQPRPGTVHGGLALLANLTSCFPGAFPPVALRPGDNGIVDEISGIVCGWGGFPPDKGGYFFDGGVLDNKPFMSTLEAIFTRPSLRLVDRRLFYVEPDPAYVKPGAVQAVPATPADHPNFAHIAMQALSGVPRAEPIINDLRALAEHNRKVASLARMTRELRQRLPEFIYGPAELPAGSRSRRRAARRNVIPIPMQSAVDPAGDERPIHHDRVLLTVPEPLLSVYRESRKESISLRIATALYREIEDETHATSFLQAFSVWAADPANERRLFDSDIYFLRRRLSHIVYFLHELLSGKDVGENEGMLTERFVSDIVSLLQRVVTMGGDDPAERDLGKTMVTLVSEFLTGALGPLEPSSPEHAEVTEHIAKLNQVQELIEGSEPSPDETVQALGTWLPTFLRFFIGRLTGEHVHERARRLMTAMLRTATELKQSMERTGAIASYRGSQLERVLISASQTADFARMLLPDGTPIRVFFTGALRVPENTQAERLKEIRRARQSVSELLRLLNRLAELYEVIGRAVERLVTEAKWGTEAAAAPRSEAGGAGLTPIELWRVFAAALESVLAQASEVFPRDPAELEREIRTLSAGDYVGFLATRNLSLTKQIAVVLGKSAQELLAVPPNDAAQRFVQLLDDCEGRLLGPSTDVDTDPRRYVTLGLWNSFERMDAVLFPVELVAGAGERDIVEVHRISAVDAQTGFSAQSAADKVAGDIVGHFGGFLKRSWRSNDILWGRLDGCCRLIEELLEEPRVRFVLASERERLRDSFFDANGELKEPLRPSCLFPKAPAVTKERLATWVKALLGDDANASRAALAELADIRELLIEAEQLEILHQDLVTVFEDQYIDELKWRTPDLDKRPVAADDAPPPSKIEYLDSGLNLVRARERALARLTTIADDPTVQTASRPRETALGAYFYNDYKVGAEQLMRVVPPAILLNWITHTLLLVRTCLFNSFVGPGQVVQQNQIFRFAIDLPLRLMHGFSALWIRSPKSLQMTIKFTAAVVFVLGVFLNLIGPTTRWTVALLLILPAIVFVTISWFTRDTLFRIVQRVVHDRQVKRVVGGTFIALFAFAAVGLALAAVWSTAQNWSIGDFEFTDIARLPGISLTDLESDWFPILATWGAMLSVLLAFLVWKLTPAAAPATADVETANAA